MHQTKQHIQHHYTPLVLIFLAVALFIGAAVYYLAFIKSVVVVQTVPITSTTDFSYTTDALDALVVETTITDNEFIYDQFDTTATVPGIARGTVTIENHYSADQSLVRTTRLLSNTGVLFHTDATITVPAGGKIDVAVYADQLGDTGNIAPSTFEIVALWQGLKDKIYATSTETMTGGVVSKNVITEADSTAAKIAAEQQLRTTAVAALTTAVQTEASGITANSLQLTTIKQTTAPASGTETDKITVITTAQASALAFTTEKLLNLLQQQFKQTITADAVQYNVVIEGDKSKVTGQVDLTKVITAQDIDTTQLTGKTKEQVKSYLEQQPGIQSVPLDTIRFSPFWLTTLPASWNKKILIIIQS